MESQNWFVGVKSRMFVHIYSDTDNMMYTYLDIYFC